MATTEFFADQTEQSRTKARIVSKYFDGWSNVLAPVARRRGVGLQYIDLFAGPGRYEDGSESTPLLVLRKALAKPKLHDLLYPERMPDGDGKEVRLLPEHHYGLACQAALGCVDSCGLLHPEATTMLWVDPQETKIDLWGCGGVRVRQLMKAKNVEPQKIDGLKPVLLDAADIFAYVAGRALSAEDSRYKRQCQELFELCHPLQAKGWWQPEAG